MSESRQGLEAISAGRFGALRGVTAKTASAWAEAYTKGERDLPKPARGVERTEGGHWRFWVSSEDAARAAEAGA